MTDRIIAACVVLVVFTIACAAPPDQFSGTAQPTSDHVLERFKFSLNDGAILLPVMINDKRHHFTLDTGASVLMTDSSLVAGTRPIGVERERFSRKQLQIFQTPEAYLREQRLDTIWPTAAAFDFSRMSEVAGQRVSGMIGYPFFESRVVQVDFDAEEVRVLKQVPADCGEKIEIFYPYKNTPFVLVKIADDQTEKFLIDTGHAGFKSGFLRPKLRDALLAESKCHSIGAQLNESLKGTTTSRLFQADRLSVGNLVTSQPVFGENSENILGLHYLSRYLVTIDASHKCMYLKPGKRFDQPDLFDRSGLHILRRDGQAFVHSVDPNSPATMAGIQSGDLILRVAKTPGDNGPLMVMRRALCQPGADVPIVIERDGKEINISLHLAPATSESQK